jgi:FKBP-type peptidyl-prolyl cis-trans isomerase FkpA
MTHRRTFLALAAAFSLAAFALPAAGQKAPSTDDQKTIYALGIGLARNLEPFHLKPDELEYLFAGMRDQIAGKQPQVALDEYGPKIRTLAESRTATASAAEKAAGADFLAKEAAAPGATKTASGLIKRVITPGTGAQPSADDSVKVSYEGKLRDGTVFDSTAKHGGQPAVMPLGRVIPCWTEALQTMKVGEKAHITCPPDLAYGDHGAPPLIPPGATLAFDVQLIEIVKPEPGAAQTPGSDDGSSDE